MYKFMSADKIRKLKYHVPDCCPAALDNGPTTCWSSYDNSKKYSNQGNLNKI